VDMVDSCYKLLDLDGFGEEARRVVEEDCGRTRRCNTTHVLRPGLVCLPSV
jgi:hypothetical protein